MVSLVFPDKMSKGPKIKPGGIGQYFEGRTWDGKCVEVHSSTCAHCAHMTEFPSRKAMMEHVDICYGCMKLICLPCHGKPCTPQELECERIEREAKLQHRIVQGSWGCY